MRLTRSPADREITRLEGFSDAVFGFALTLLVVSLEVPKTEADLLETMRGFGAFAVCFAIVGWIWYEHNLFFRRYGLQDGWTILLNFLLLFVVVFYVYPLKFIATTLLGGLFGGASSRGSTSFGSGAGLMLIYSVALLVLFLVFALLYWHALRHRAKLELDALGVFDATTHVWRHLLTVAIAASSVLLVLTVPTRVHWAGLIYFLIGPVHAGFGFLRGAQRGRVAARLSASAA